MMSRTVISLSRVLVLALAVLSLGACSSSHMQAGTDGVTHWLRDCDTSAECGELQCLCGVCTLPCEQNAACADLGASAECVSAEGGSCATGVQICDRAVSPGPVDGGGAQDSGPIDAGAIDSGPINHEVCEAMDARSNGTFCGGTFGYAWDGTGCEEILCGCAGSDCDRAYATRIECMGAHLVCLGPTACTEPSQCGLVPAECCACGDLGPGEVFAITRSERHIHEAQACGRIECEACAIEPLAKTYARVAAVCNAPAAGQGGQCGTLDLTQLPCTEEVGCRPRVARCCECGGDPTVDEIFAMPIGFDAYGTFCDTGATCCDAEPRYPDNVEARCVDAVCELFEDGALVPR